MGQYAGMTTLERLASAGLLEAFDKAILGGDRTEACRILTLVEIAESEATAIVSTVLSSPRKYGYHIDPR